MSIFDQYRNSKQFWIITVLVIILVACLAVLGFLMATKPAGPADAGPSPSEPSSSEEEPHDPAFTDPGEWDDEESSSESEEPEPSSSLAPSSSSAPASSSSSYTPPASYTPSTGSGNVTIPSGSGALNITKAGSYDTSAVHSSVTISADDVGVRNKTVSGDIVVKASVGGGTVLIQNTVVKGKIIIQGGGRVKLYGVTCPEVVAQYEGGGTVLEVGGKTTVQTLNVKGHVTLDEANLTSGYAGVKAASINETSRLWQELTLSDANLEKLTVNTLANVTVPAGSSIDAVTANARLHLAGKGTVGKLTVAANDVTYEYRPSSIDTRNGYNDPYEDTLKVGETPTGGGDSGDSDSGGGSSSSRDLDTPKNLLIEAGSNARTVVLSWSSVSRARGYDLVIYVNGEQAKTASLSSGTTKYTYTNSLLEKDGATLYFTLVATGNGSSLHDSDMARSGTYIVGKTGTPSGLAITSASADKTITFSFTRAPGATGYKLTPIVNGSRMAAQTLKSNVTSYSYKDSVNVGKEGSTFAFEVIALGDSSHEDSDPVLSETVTVAPLPIPEKITVSSVSGSTTAVSLSFTKVDGAAGYTATPILNGKELTGEAENLSSGATTLRYTNSALSKDGASIQFKVTARGDGKLTLDSTGMSNVLADGALDAPANLKVSADSADSTVRFSFDGVDGASGYRVVPIVNGKRLAERSLSASETSYDYKDAATVGKEGSTFAFEVTARGGSLKDDSPAVQSEAVTVKRLAAPDGLEIRNTGSGVLTFSFGKVDGASGYKVVPVVTTGGKPADQDAISLDPNKTTCEFKHDKVGAEGYAFSFRVSALGDGKLTLDSDEKTSGSAAAEALKTPTGLAIKAGGPGKLIFSFDKVADAAGYSLVPVVDGAKLEAVALGKDANSYTFTHTRIGNENATFSFRVTAKGDGSLKKDSEAAQSQTIAVKRLSAPGNLQVAASSGTATFTFDKVPGAAGYTVTPVLTINGKPADQAAITLGANQTSAPFSDGRIGQSDTAVSFRVVANGDGVLTLDSQPAASAPFESKTLSTPSDLKIVPGSSGQLVFSFNPVSGAAGYTLTPVVDGAKLEAVSLGKDAKSYTFSHARVGEQGATFAFTLTAKGDGGPVKDSAEAQSGTQTVTALSKPGNPTTVKKSDDTVAFSFSAVSGAKSYVVTPIVNDAPLSAKAQTITKTSLEYQDSRLADPGTTAAFSVMAVGDGSLTLSSDLATSAEIATAANAEPPEPQKPAAPAAPSVSAGGADTIVVSFAKSDGGYELIPVVDGADQTPISIGKNTASYSYRVSAGDLGKSICFKLVALGDGEKSGESGESGSAKALAAAVVTPLRKGSELGVRAASGYEAVASAGSVKITLALAANPAARAEFSSADGNSWQALEGAESLQSSSLLVSMTAGGVLYVMPTAEIEDAAG